MENIKEKMLDALNSVFWYEGLLAQSDPSNDEYSEDCWLMKFIKDLEENTNTKYKEMYTATDLEVFMENNTFDGAKFDYEKRHTVIWQMLVEMFGSCGTSPRYGWIEDRKACAEFLKTIVNAQCVN